MVSGQFEVSLSLLHCIVLLLNNIKNNKIYPLYVCILFTVGVMDTVRDSVMHPTWKYHNHKLSDILLVNKSRPH